MRRGEFKSIISIVTKTLFVFVFFLNSNEYRKNTDINNNALKVPVSVIRFLVNTNHFTQH